MYTCKKCGKMVENKDKLCKGLCFDCYYQYLFDKIENYRLERQKPTIYKEKKPNRLISFIKKLFKRKEK